MDPEGVTVSVLATKTEKECEGKAKEEKKKRWKKIVEKSTILATWRMGNGDTKKESKKKKSGRGETRKNPWCNKPRQEREPTRVGRYRCTPTVRTCKS